MTRKKKILVATAALLMLAVASFAITISHDSPCGPAPALSSDAIRMRAIVHRCYGGGEALTLEEVAKPVPRENEVLVRVRASSVNPYEWHMTTGKPYVMRLGMGIGAPEDTRIGVDFAGVVEAVGAKVTKLKPGDEVFGGVGGGAFAEYLTTSESHSIARKPAELSFEEAASIPIAGITALKALRDHGKLQAGQHVLINGASGGVGTFAVQVAKAMGARVTGVCSTRNVELVRSLGADEVIDYTREDFTRRPARYHMILDNVGNRSFSDLRKVLEPKGTVVLVGGPKGPWIDPFRPLIKGMLVKPFVDEKFVFFVSNIRTPELEFMAELAREGKLRPAVGSRYSLREVPAALDYLGGRHASGKVVIRID
jgi:NADPH:quinone reductase-like Zn-dependent oxidoreductase